MFQVLVRRDSGKFIRDPSEVYHRLCAGLGKAHLTLEEFCKVSNRQDLEQELSLSGKSVDSYPDSFLGAFEKGNLLKYEELLGTDSLEMQAYVLGQNPTYMNKSTTCGKLPTFTKSDKVTWIPALKRHLLAIEKFTGHGYPTTPKLASMLKVPAT